MPSSPRPHQAPHSRRDSLHVAGQALEGGERAARQISRQFYNFCRPHMMLTKAHPYRYPTTPAMAAGIAGHVWTVEEMVS